MQMDLYDTKGSSYPVPSAANSKPAGQQPTKEDVGFVTKLVNLLSRANLPDSRSMAGRTDRAVRDTRDEISDRSKGQHPEVRMGGDTYEKSPQDWAREFPPAGAAPAAPMPMAEEEAPVPPSGPAPGGPMASLKKRSSSSSSSGRSDEAGGEPDAYIRSMESLLKRVEGKKELDLTPLLALTDTWTGSNFARTYDRPLTQDEREKMALSLRANIQSHKDNLDYKREALKQQRELAEERLDVQREGMANRAATAAATAATRAGEKKGKDAEAARTKLGREHKGTLDTIAQHEHFNPKNPESKDWKGFTASVHQELLDAAQWAVDNGKAPDLRSAYQYMAQARLAQAMQPRPQED